jgi:hypothetical protein
MEMLLDSSRIVPNPTNNLPSPSASNDSTIVINHDVSQTPMITASGQSRSSVASAIGETTSIPEEEGQSGTGDSTSELREFDNPNTSNGVEDASELGFSPPVQWIIEKADNSSAINGAFTEAGLFDPLKAVTGASILPTGFKRPVHLPLPPKEELLRLVEVFFHGYNRFFPLFDPQSFMSLLERQFAGQPDKRVGWWASLNAVIAIGLLLQGPENGGIDATGQAWGYTHNAFGAFTELTIRSTDLLSVQALLSMAVLMQGNGDPQATAMLVTSALTLSHILASKRSRPGADNDPATARQSRRAFWIACRMDRELSMVSELPLMQNTADISVELPEENPPDSLGDVSHSEGNGKINIFRLIVQLSVIEAKVHQCLYTTEGSQQSEKDLMRRVVELDQQLEEWKVSVPIDFQPEYEIKTPDFYLRQYIITLHFNYYNCLSNIHYACMRLSKSNHISPETSSQIILSRSLYMSAARAMIRLTRYISKETPPFVWYVVTVSMHF